MYKKIIDMLVCPICREKLILTEGTEENGSYVEGRLSCVNGHSWDIHEGVLDFGSKEQEMANNWEEMYKQTDFDGLDKQIAEKTPQELRELFGRAKQYITDSINETKPELVIDIATGRGMLLTALAEHVNTDTHLVCVDLSHQVLKYDRIKVNRINPHIKVSYIACDATRLPFADAAFGLAVSFFGIANMMDVLPEGLREASRILKPEGRLLDTGIIIKKTSPGYETMKQIYAQENLKPTYDFCTMEGMEQYHLNAGFGTVEIAVNGDGIGPKNELDLIPFEGEWYAIVTACCSQ